MDVWSGFCERIRSSWCARYAAPKCRSDEPGDSWRDGPVHRPLVSLLVDEENGAVRIAQSLAILDYLEEIFPAPADPVARAQIRALALHLAGEVQPLNNLRVRQHLSRELDVDDAAKNAW